MKCCCYGYVKMLLGLAADEDHNPADQLISSWSDENLGWSEMTSCPETVNTHRCVCVCVTIMTPISYGCSKHPPAVGMARKHQPSGEYGGVCGRCELQAKLLLVGYEV